jgi:hypothetical protein
VKKDRDNSTLVFYFRKQFLLLLRRQMGKEQLACKSCRIAEATLGGDELTLYDVRTGAPLRRRFAKSRQSSWQSDYVRDRCAGRPLKIWPNCPRAASPLLRRALFTL